MLENIHLVDAISSMVLDSQAVSNGLEFDPGYDVLQMPLIYRFSVPSMGTPEWMTVFFPVLNEEMLELIMIVQTPTVVHWHSTINFIDFLKMQTVFRTNLVKLPMNVDVSDINTYKG